MKLSYIWIEEYKGFSNQGFNFGSEYTYEFSTGDRLLSRKKNDKFINGFFGDQIKDIKGIIGKNASGKTNILELVQYIVDGANTIINRPFFVVVDEGQSSIVYNCKLPEIKYRHRVKLEPYPGKLPGFDSIFFSNVFDGRRHNFTKNIINISTNEMLQSQFGENINKNYQKTIQQQIAFIESPQFRLLEDVEYTIDPTIRNQLRPSTVVITSPLWSNISGRARTFEERFYRATGKAVDLRDFIASFRRKITDNKSSNVLRYLTAFLVYIDFIFNRDFLRTIEDNREQYLDRLFGPVQADFRIDEIFRFFTNEFANLIDDHFGAFETHKFLYELRDYNFDELINSDYKEDIGSYSNRKVQFTIYYSEKIGAFIKGYLEAVTNQSLSYSIEWAGISSGHKAYINLFANFYSVLPKIKAENLLISIDEGDLYFHPKWQTEFLFKILTILPRLLDIDCQILITTHSPFLVSDLPKSNLLFVEKNSNSTLSVMNNERIQGETFGGNIGELYLDAFFMQGKLISHFAASKIQRIIDRIRTGHELTDEERIVITSIGDDLIRTQLENIANDKDR